MKNSKKGHGHQFLSHLKSDNRFLGTEAIEYQEYFYDKLIQTSDMLMKSFAELAIAGVAITWIFHINPNFAQLQFFVGISMGIFIFEIFVDLLWALSKLLFYYHYSNPKRLIYEENTDKASVLEVPLNKWSFISWIVIILRVLLLFIAYSFVSFCLIKVWNF